MHISSRTIIGSVFLLIVITRILIGLCQPATASAQANTPDFANIDREIETMMAERGVPGAALVIVHHNQIVHLKGFGKADDRGRMVTPHTPFRIGSVTKSFTALAIMQLVEAGKIELATPVQHYLPWFTLKDPSAAAQITIAQLLHQTSGIPSDALAAALADPTLTLEQFGRNMRHVTPDRPVGSSFVYANANYNLLGLIIETVSGQSYADYVQQHIFTPLNMRHSFATPQSQGQGELAMGYQWFFGVPLPTPDRFIPSSLPAGFISSSAEDIGQYLIAQINGGRYNGTNVLSAAGIATLHAPGENAQLEETATMSGQRNSYGMGWINGPVYGVPAVWHNGDDSRNGSFMLITNSGWGMAILINSSNPLSELEPTETIVSRATRLLAGLEPTPTSMPTIGMTYLVVNSIMIVLSLLLIANIRGVVIWRRNPTHRSRVHLLWQLLRLTIELGIAGTVFFGIPWLYSSWQLMIFGVPDVAWWLLTAATVLLITGLMRIIRLTRLIHVPPTP